MGLIWRGDAVQKEIAVRAQAAVDEINLRIEAGAKRELYPGHGRRFGTLQRGIQTEPARVEGSRVIGSVGVKGVKYALRIHKLYQYIFKGLEQVRPQAEAILRKHVTR